MLKDTVPVSLRYSSLLRKRPHSRHNLLQLILFKQVGDLARVENVIDVFEKFFLDDLSKHLRKIFAIDRNYKNLKPHFF